MDIHRLRTSKSYGHPGLQVFTDIQELQTSWSLGLYGHTRVTDMLVSGLYGHPRVTDMLVSRSLRTSKSYRHPGLQVFTDIQELQTSWSPGLYGHPRVTNILVSRSLRTSKSYKHPGLQVFTDIQGLQTSWSSGLYGHPRITDLLVPWFYRHPQVTDIQKLRTFWFWTSLI